MSTDCHRVQAGLSPGRHPPHAEASVQWTQIDINDAERTVLAMLADCLPPHGAGFATVPHIAECAGLTGHELIEFLVAMDRRGLVIVAPDREHPSLAAITATGQAALALSKGYRGRLGGR